jgi:hypothetical protein
MRAALRESVVSPDAPAEKIRMVKRSYAAGFPLYLIAFAVAPWYPKTSLGICVALWAFWAITPG